MPQILAREWKFATFKPKGNNPQFANVSLGRERTLWWHGERAYAKIQRVIARVAAMALMTTAPTNNRETFSMSLFVVAMRPCSLWSSRLGPRLNERVTAERRSAAASQPRRYDRSSIVRIDD